MLSWCNNCKAYTYQTSGGCTECGNVNNVNVRYFDSNSYFKDLSPEIANLINDNFIQLLDNGSCKESKE